MPKWKDDQKIKPIIGCEFYVCEDHTDKTRRDDGYQVVFLAKNKKGLSQPSKIDFMAYVRWLLLCPEN